MNYVYQGSLTQVIGGRKIRLEKGEIIFLNQYISHEIEASSKEDIIINFIIRPEFFDYIFTLLKDENYDNASLGEISENLKQPNYKLSKLIKKHTGMTFKELLQEKRLSKAVELLKISTYSITEIIELIGYENPTYFYKIFEKKYGVTPRKYDK